MVIRMLTRNEKNFKLRQTGIIRLLKNKPKAVATIFVVAFLVVLSLVLINSHGKNLISDLKSKNFLAGAGIYTKEVPSIEIKSDDFDNNKSGSYKVTKSAKWTSDKKARITFNIDSVLKTGDNKKDVLLVMDISGSMSGSKLDKAKSDAESIKEKHQEKYMH